MLRSTLAAALVLILLLTAGCDSTDPADLPEPFFEAALLDEQGESLSFEGAARLSPGAFNQGLFFSLPVDWSDEDMHVTGIVLTTSGGEIVHTIGFAHVGDDRPASGEELPIQPQVFSFTPGEDAASNDVPARPGELTFATYQRTTSDSLFMYLPSGGTLHIERASDDEMTGTFAIEIAALRVFSLDDWTPSGSGATSDPDDFPGRFEVFPDPLILEGSFTAVPPEE